MGYSTDFEGALRFKRVMNGEELAFIKQLFWIEEEDIIKLGLKAEEPNKPHYVQLCLTDDFSGIKWDGSEKFYNAVEAVNFIIVNCKERFPDFGLVGEMQAQGEDYDDRWVLSIGEDGLARKVDQPRIGQRVTCPHCDEDFTLESTNDQ